MSSELTRQQVAELSAAILARGLDVDRLAAAAGLDVTALGWIMQGRLRPTDDIRRRLAEALGVNPEALG